MDQPQNNLLADIESYVRDFFDANISPNYVYHDLNHTLYVVESVSDFSVQLQLSEVDKEIVLIASWFHDTGYDQGQVGHEERSCTYAKAFLQERKYPPGQLNKVLGCIRATKLPQNPQNLLEEIICDSDLAHLGNETYWDRCARVRQEMLLTKNVIMSEQEWVDFELDFVANHEYHTDIARDLFDKRKEKHISQLRKQKFRLNPKLAELVEDSVVDKKKKKKKRRKVKPDVENDLELKKLNLGRGVETMYRTTYRTHVNLSSIADNKANFMLTINGVVISMILTNLFPKFADNPELQIPTITLLVFCLTALIFAILATRPKVTEGKFTREDIEQKRSNLLFFGNFYNMNIEDFHWGMTEMIKDSDFLYSSMTRDLYYLGVVLAKKYRYLRICYGIFMYGIILSVLAFGISFLIYPPA